MRQLYVLSILCIQLISYQSAKGQGTLVPGDIAIIGLNCDPNNTTAKTFAIVALTDLPASEVIYFSDKAYYDDTFSALLGNGSEGTFSWTLPAGGVPKGTMIQFTLTSSSTSPSITTSPVTGVSTILEGWTTDNAITSSFGQNGDNILIYQGTPAVPKFIFGFNCGLTNSGIVNGWNTGLTTNVNGSCELPAALAAGDFAIGFGGPAHRDNWHYNGNRVGTKTYLLDEITNPANWISNDDTPYDLLPGGTIYTGAQPIFIISTVLPVDIILFSGRSAAGTHLLSWQVANEGQLKQYDIEVSINGTQFTTAGTVMAEGKAAYRFTSQPGNGQQRSWYRLKSIDIDGRYRYSRTVMLFNAADKQGISCFPNPVISELSLNSYDKIKGLSLFSSTGIRLLTQQTNSHSTRLSLRNFPTGIYYLQLETENGIKTERILKAGY
ncbi:T9SS type A sorting domain-containing protein [Ferruginibacter sp. HRS2-29]|uniref:T9SS type A sorting domain-containing protein n=1 Tax=Ferruginibacter sp. HRS2-29 TaxID=2487334 RepID=UPI0020CC9B0A|nr:T9SS type A sorting domain-containing protein [Ferruginibacter sp. HRS2-29]MCP9750388.1 T9SS C-terminal target domain-containing protein [Ferruginibacter sp. HRS2-29]